MSTPKTRAFCNAVRAVDETARFCDVIASTEDIDSYGTILDAGSWRLARYANNPVVCLNHNSRALPIGHASNVRIVGKELHARIHFASELGNPDAERAYQLVREGALRGVSVGFVPGGERSERRNGESVVVLYDNELYELSLCTIPSNPGAGVVGVRSTSGYAHIDPITESQPELARRMLAQLPPVPAPVQAEEGTRHQAPPGPWAEDPYAPDAFAINRAMGTDEERRLHDVFDELGRAEERRPDRHARRVLETVEPEDFASFERSLAQSDDDQLKETFTRLESRQAQRSRGAT